MSSDGDNHPLPPKRQRRRQINVPDSSDESDSAIRRNPRRRNTSRRTNGSEEAGTSRLDERANGISDKLPNSISPSINFEGMELRHRSTASKAKTVTEEAATSSKNIAESNVSDTQNEQCPICLITFVNQEVASPSSCEHFFCFACLMEWSKSKNTCPVDRKPFDLMDVRPKLGEKVVRRIPVTVPNTNADVFETDAGDVDYSDDDYGVAQRIGSVAIAALRDIFPRALHSPNTISALSSSDSETSSENFCSWNRDNNLSSPSVISGSSSLPDLSENNEASSIEYNEPSSPIIIEETSSDNDQISESSSPSDHHEASSQSDNEQCSSPDRNDEEYSSESSNHQISSPSDNQGSSSPSAEQHYSSVEDSPIVEEEPSSPSVKSEPLTASEGEEQSSDIERYSYSSDKDESPPPSEDDRTDYGSEASDSYSSY